MKSDDAMRGDEAGFRSLCDAMPIGVFLSDAQGNCTFTNRYLQTLGGFTCDEALGEGFAKFIHPQDRSRVMTERTMPFGPSGVLQYQFRFLRPDESIRWAKVRRVPVCNSAGIYTGNVGTIEDITDHILIEETLKRREAQLAEAQQLAQIGSWQHDSATGTVLWSDELWRLFGLTPREFGPSFEEFLAMVHPDDRHLLESINQRSQGQSEDFAYDYRIIRADGSLRWLRAQGRIVLDDDGQTVRVGGTDQDITERKLAKEKQKESDEWLRAILMASRDGIVIEDNGTIVYTNTAFAHLLGYDATEEIAGLSIYELVPRDECERMSEYGKARLRGESPPSVYEFKAKRKDGSLIKLEASVSTSTVAGKIYISTAVRDIAERKQAEAALQAADHRAITEYERLLNRLASLAQSLSSARDLTAIYRALCHFTVASAPCSGVVTTIFHPEKQAREAVYFWKEGEELVLSEVPLIPVGEGLAGKAIRTGEIIVCDDYMKAQSDRPRVWVGPQNDALPRPALIAPMTIMGRVIGTIEIQNDQGKVYTAEHVTAMKMAANLAAGAIDNVRLLEQEREQELRLQQSQKMEAIGTLAGGVAHDFNNLLTVILGNTELAFNKIQATDPIGPRLVEIEKAANRAAVLTRQLLAFGRRQQMERRNINLNKVIAEIMKLLNRIIGADVEVNVRAASNLSTVFADPAQIEQIVMNLAVNARDAMPQGGLLKIETSNITLDEAYQRGYPNASPGKFVELKVSDTGSGMDEATKGRIFEPFFTTKEVGKGTGLGLSMVYGIVKQHDGHISVFSETGQGTTFRIILPVVENAVEKDEHEIQPEVIGGTETILLAEDEEGLRNLATDVLNHLGYTVLQAKDGEAAVQLYVEHREKIDLLLLDVMMPRLGGPEAYERIREIDPEIPLIFMTGYSPDIVASRFVNQNDLIRESGAMVIQKPYNIDVLGRHIREVLDTAAAAVSMNQLNRQPLAEDSVAGALGANEPLPSEIYQAQQPIAVVKEK
jgi:PAS domain S-box-containing protein